MTRTFEHKQAELNHVPLSVGLIGPSGGGKTYSALRLATGIRSVTGGEIFVIDTEARRALHYAKDFRFQHIDFRPPFCPTDYLAAIEHAANNGAKVVVIDSMSHEHVGVGGVLDQHNQEAERLGKLWKTSSDAANFAAWAAPKAKRDKLLNAVTQLGVTAIYCFRAKEKTKPVKRGETVEGKTYDRSALVELGLMPIGGEELIYEFCCNMILDAGCDGVPTVRSDDIGTRRIIKIPGQFRALLNGREPLSEAIGEKMARWSTGEDISGRKQATEPRPAGNVDDAIIRIEGCPVYELEHLKTELREFSWTVDDGRKIAAAFSAKITREPGQEG